MYFQRIWETHPGWSKGFCSRQIYNSSSGICGGYGNIDTIQNIYDTCKVGKLSYFLAERPDIIYGTVSHKQAVEKATDEYRKYKARMLSTVEEDYLNPIKQLEQKTEKQNHRLAMLHFAFKNLPLTGNPETRC